MGAFMYHLVVIVDNSNNSRVSLRLVIRQGGDLVGWELFKGKDSSQNSALHAQGLHKPDNMARESGIWINSAGAAMLSRGKHHASVSDWVWMVLPYGKLLIKSMHPDIHMKAGDACILPPGTGAFDVQVEQDARLLWMSVTGRLADEYMTELGACGPHAMKQGTLPTQIRLAEHIVQAVVRHTPDDDESSSAHLQQLMWAMLASHSGQPVAMDVVLSHEIAKVIDAMRNNRYRDSLSLNDMSEISRMPVETFRKRFVAEVGIPPQTYQTFCKMERAKTLLKKGLSVRQTGAEVGMNDPYHFSKTFKNVVGFSPSVYSKVAQR